MSYHKFSRFIFCNNFWNSDLNNWKISKHKIWVYDRRPNSYPILIPLLYNHRHHLLALCCLLHLTCPGLASTELALRRSGNRQALPGLTWLDGKRPDGQTLVLWNNGRSLIWDATVVDTVAASYVTETVIEAGGTAEKAATKKHSKYIELERTYTVVPIAMGSFHVKSTRKIAIVHHTP